MVRSLLSQAWSVLLDNARWMSWNLFLAFIPLVLSVLLFRQTQLPASTLTLPPVGLRSRHRSFWWWIGVVVFIAFLPNAPYILTDIIHFINHVQSANSAWFVTLVLIPLYVLFIGAGFEAYVLSLINLGYYLNRRGLTQWILLAEMMLHGLSAIGIYLGRFLRFNSWDLVTRLDEVAMTVLDDLLGKRPLLAMMLTFLIVAGLYALIKPVHLALFTYWKSRQSRSQFAID
ncbi:MAG: DUF1361 domain-containing protein [Myxacorys californica WJT36-NPBG1]|nr:DUF1361 domain-containing protein [Myxacorys californica WJT36-NPBG1]